jgi:hypothetical protein
VVEVGVAAITLVLLPEMVVLVAVAAGVDLQDLALQEQLILEVAEVAEVMVHMVLQPQVALVL